MPAQFRLDINTLFAVLALINFAGLIFAIILYFSHQIFAGARLWILGQATIVMASASFVLRDITPPIIGIVLPNSLYLLAQLAFLGSIWNFRYGRHMPRPLWLLLPVFALVIYLNLLNSINVRILIFSLVLGMTSFLTATPLFIKIPKKLRLPSYLLGITFSIIGIVQLLRIPEALGPTITSLQTESTYGTVIYLISILSAYTMLFGYFLMSTVRSEEELHKKEQAIEHKNQELEDLNKSKGLLLSVIAHDLQAPIASAARYVDNFLLPAEVKLEEKQKALSILGLTLNKASKLLTDMLMWAENQQASGKLERSAFRVDDLVHQAREMLDSEAKVKNVSFVVQTGDVMASVDRRSAVTVLRNLMSNALKFSKSGDEITIQAQQLAHGTSIRVSDTGIGIEPQNLEILRHGSKIITTTGTYGEYGNGLGLLLCRSLMARHGGSLDIESTPGKGTAFIANFPE